MRWQQRPLRTCVLTAAAVAVITPACAHASTGERTPPVRRAEVVATFPRDPTCFTEGLQWTGAGFLDSCGLYGQSRVQESRLDGTVRRSVPIAPEYFGEGIVRLGRTVYQLTYRERVALVRDAETLADRGSRPLPEAVAEGWGLTTDGKLLVVSDGTPVIRWLDPSTLAVVRSVTVRSGGQEVRLLNELEMVGPELWANVWLTDRIMRIDPSTGRVTSILDLAALRPAATRQDGDAVLNGIAYDAAAKRVFVTGKRWPTLYQIRLRA